MSIFYEIEFAKYILPYRDFIGDAQSLSAPCESYAQPEFMTNGARNAAFESEKSAVA